MSLYRTEEDLPGGYTQPFAVYSSGTCTCATVQPLLCVVLSLQFDFLSLLLLVSTWSANIAQYCLYDVLRTITECWVFFFPN